MAEPICDKLKRSLESAEGLYYRLVLLVGRSGSGKTEVLRDIAEELGTSVINVNLALSRELLELTEKPTVLDNLEILFDKDLKQDPLRLLQGISRNRTVVASWSGIYAEGRLFYAETGHPEYRIYQSVDALIVDMDGTAALDSERK